MSEKRPVHLRLLKDLWEAIYSGLRCANPGTLTPFLLVVSSTAIPCFGWNRKYQIPKINGSLEAASGATRRRCGMRSRFRFCGLRWRWELESNDKFIKNGCGGMVKMSTEARAGLWWSLLNTRRL